MKVILFPLRVLADLAIVGIGGPILWVLRGPRPKL